MTGIMSEWKERIIPVHYYFYYLFYKSVAVVYLV